MSYALVAEMPEHAARIERVLARAFGPGRFAKTSERVREQGAVFEPALSRVAVSEAGAVVGVCRIWRVRAGVELFFLGPLAVDPDAQMAGLGAALTRAAVDACRASGGNGVVLVGAARFFQPLGFSLVPHGAISLPGAVDPARFLWCELRPGGLSAARGMLAAPR
ncbi:MAG TPA: N-acetyltransferase [Terricaulis sp.]|nr:N-acetyltransferase [Terricaulis sp.]